MKNLLFALLTGSFCCCYAQQKDAPVPEPEVVATPPADAGRGLIRVDSREIRHYSGTRKEPDYLVSRDNGKTWEMKAAPAGYPPNYGGIPKESPAIVRNPLTREFIRVQPIGGFVFLSRGGLDGKWLAVTNDGKLEEDWKDPEKRKNLKKLGGIMRTPVFVNKGRRVIVPFHNMGSGTKFHISDDGGLTWHVSENGITSPRHEARPPHQGVRWFNNAVEATVLEMKDGTLWALVRTSLDQAWQAFSRDYGETWSKPEPSRFFGTLTMNTLGRLDDGTIVSLWTNTMALPENATAGNGTWKDVFTNRDSHHIAMSGDEGKTWYGFREIILDEHRNHPGYATLDGPEDRGKHQSEMVQLDKNRILISLGQHKNHRRLVIVDRRWVGAKTRATQTGKDSDSQWTIHTYIPQKKGHCSYNRKPSAELVPDPSGSTKKVLQIKRLNDPELVNEKSNVDYRNAGAAWNFPNGTTGLVKFRFRAADGDQADDSGLQVSLTDRLFNACDSTTKDYALFTFPIRLRPAPHLLLGMKKAPFTPGAWHEISLLWQGGQAVVSLDGKKAGTLKMANKSPNGASYIHFISTGSQPDAGILLDTVNARVK